MKPKNYKNQNYSYCYFYFFSYCCRNIYQNNYFGKSLILKIFPLSFLKTIVSCLLCISFSSSTAFAQDDISPHGLTSMLIRDGHFARAEKTFSQFSIKDFSKEFHFYSLRGMLALNKKRFKEAEKDFKKSLELSKKGNSQKLKQLQQQELSLYLANIFLKTERTELALESLNKVGGTWSKKLAYFALKADILWKMGQREQAWITLNTALSIQPAWKNTVSKKKWAFLVSDQAYKAAFDLAWKELKQSESSASILPLAHQLMKLKQNDLALKLLEGALLKFPGDPTVGLQLAQIHLGKKSYFSASLILEELSRLHPSLAFEASELLRQTDQSYRAPLVNMAIPDPKKKLKQQLALLIEKENFISLNQLYPQMRHYGLFNNEEIRYAMAYSMFKGGQFTKSEKLLSKIQNETLFGKSIELKKEIEKCRNKSWSCRETI